MSEEKRYYMACLDLEGRSVLVVGGGRIALEKVNGLLECGADVTVVAPEARPEVRALPVRRVERGYEPEDLEGRYLVVAATQLEQLNADVARDAASPALAKRLRDQFAAQIGPRTVALARELRARRPWAKQHLATYDDRKEYFERLVEERA